MKVVVTGGAGFIGANFCRVLSAESGAEVVALDDLSTGFRTNLDGVDATLVEGSILDRDLLDEVVSGASSIVHLAAIPSVPRSVADPLASHAANATGTLEVLDAARRAGDVHVVVASSSSVYGRNPELPKHEGLRCEPMSPYAVNKLAAETYAGAYAACYDLEVLPFRFFNVFGPLQAAGHAYAAVIPAFVDAAMAGRALPVHGDGSQSRDFTYVESVTRVLREAVVRRATSASPVNLAFGSRTTLMEVVAMLGEILGRRLEVEHLPTRPGDVPHSQADDSRLRALFPELSPVPLRTGLERTVAWFEELAGSGSASGRGGSAA
ncbi:NAD-dependent epimerase/dehydratase family protein [Blastococcus saxobsidens]|uniref:GDP-D-mannose dehydratase n=1 Tax=Blastococcus saxobsidens (strain DD2) TaxID=1146883 RepID=H6RMZ5_BLASD|nr:NAD-dependent epimerase/dehydratase family protein [Blastococcus saxobsidens]CCG01348.1 GDP-D-mannose dehydratase [Blastococcus saxobsidens DD2]